MVEDSEQPEHRSADSPRGSLWTVIAAFAVFTAILLSVWFFLYPRLSGEPPSPDADLQIAAASANRIDGWSQMQTYDGNEFFVSPDPVVTAADVKTFRGSHDDSGGPVLRLTFTSDGAARLRQFTQSHRDEHLAVVINGTLVSCPIIRTEVGEFATLSLGNLPREDVEELFARLTQ